MKQIQTVKQKNPPMVSPGAQIWANHMKYEGNGKFTVQEKALIKAINTAIVNASVTGKIESI